MHHPLSGLPQCHCSYFAITGATERVSSARFAAPRADYYAAHVVRKTLTMAHPCRYRVGMSIPLLTLQRTANALRFPAKNLDITAFPPIKKDQEDACEQ